MEWRCVIIFLGRHEQISTYPRCEVMKDQSKNTIQIQLGELVIFSQATYRPVGEKSL